MITVLITCLALLGLSPSHQARLPKPKRGYLLGDYSHGGYVDDLVPSQSGWKVTTGDFNLNVDLPPPPSVAFIPKNAQSINVISSNSLEKPVMEAQEYVPPQSTGTAILPQMPPPATPVNAAASNIPSQGGAVFLGSGSIGVVSLGNGAYALGSGAIGYSGNRAQPRPTGKVPVYPPLQASPNLIPAAVPSPAPQQPFGYDFNYPLNVPQVPQVDQNGYEYLPPNRVGFGQPNPPRPIRTRQQFATPTALQLQQQGQIPSNYQLPLSLETTGGGFAPLF